MTRSWPRTWRYRWIRWQRWRQRLTPAVRWDGLMIYLALVNVWLIGFDFTYLWLRPYYFEYLPLVAEVYDPVKGIEAQPLTSDYLERVDRLRAALATDAPEPVIEATIAKMIGPQIAENLAKTE